MDVSGVITLTTDFGCSDPYVGIMKGVILSINSQARMVDISHQIRPGSIRQAAAVFEEAYPFFPGGTVHVVVVDPGVGGSRRPIIIETERYFFVGPDNGIFWPVFNSNHKAKVIHLTEDNYFLPKISHTFHGRDIFAPVAAHLSRGVSPLDMGRPIRDLVPLKSPKVQQDEGVLSGQVIRVDHFGNLITNITQEDLVRFLGHSLPVITVGCLTIETLSKTFAERKPNQALALIGSSDRLEIAVNLGRASDNLGLAPEKIVGVKVEVRYASSQS